MSIPFQQIDIVSTLLSKLNGNKAFPPCNTGQKAPSVYLVTPVFLLSNLLFPRQWAGFRNIIFERSTMRRIRISLFKHQNSFL